jgi:hypothetical protein
LQLLVTGATGQVMRALPLMTSPVGSFPTSFCIFLMAHCSQHQHQNHPKSKKNLSGTVRREADISEENGTDIPLSGQKFLANGH